MSKEYRETMWYISLGLEETAIIKNEECAIIALNEWHALSGDPKRMNVIKTLVYVFKRERDKNV